MFARQDTRTRPFAKALWDGYLPRQVWRPRPADVSPAWPPSGQGEEALPSRTFSLAEIRSRLRLCKSRRTSASRCHSLGPNAQRDVLAGRDGRAAGQQARPPADTCIGRVPGDVGNVARVCRSPRRWGHISICSAYRWFSWWSTSRGTLLVPPGVSARRYARSRALC